MADPAGLQSGAGGDRLAGALSRQPFLRFVRALFASDATGAAQALASCGEAALLARLEDEKLDAAAHDRLLGLPPVLSEAGMARLDARRRQYLAHAILRRAEAEELLESLRSRGIPAAGLKGVDLAWRVYPDPALRPATDIDLLVPAERLAEAETVVLAAGYTPEARTAELRAKGLDWVDYQYTHPQSEVMIELHVELLHPGRFALPGAECLARARDGFLAPGDRFVHLALHLAKHGYFGRLIWVHDLALLLAEGEPPAEWGERARIAGGGGATWLALRVTHALFGVRAGALEKALRPGWPRRALLEGLAARIASRPGDALSRRLLQLLLFDDPGRALRYTLARVWRRTTRARAGW